MTKLTLAFTVEGEIGRKRIDLSYSGDLDVPDEGISLPLPHGISVDAKQADAVLALQFAFLSIPIVHTALSEATDKPFGAVIDGIRIAGTFTVVPG